LDLTTAAAAARCVSDSPTVMIRPGGLLLVVSHLFAIPSSSFMGGVGNEVNKL